MRLLFKGVFRVEDNAIFGYDGGNHFVRKEGPSEGCLLLRAQTQRLAAGDNITALLQEVERRFEHRINTTYKRCAELDVAARLRLNFCD